MSLAPAVRVLTREECEAIHKIAYRFNRNAHSAAQGLMDVLINCAPYLGLESDRALYLVKSRMMTKRQLAEVRESGLALHSRLSMLAEGIATLAPPAGDERAARELSSAAFYLESVKRKLAEMDSYCEELERFLWQAAPALEG